MLIHVKVLNHPSIAETSFEVKASSLWFVSSTPSLQVSPSDTIQQLKTLVSDRLHIPVQQQKLILRGKPLHEGSLRDYSIADGAKLHLAVSGTLNAVPTSSPTSPAFVEQLKLLAAKWTNDPKAREEFVAAFQTVANEAKRSEFDRPFSLSFRK